MRNTKSDTCFRVRRARPADVPRVLSFIRAHTRNAWPTLGAPTNASQIVLSDYVSRSLAQGYSFQVHLNSHHYHQRTFPGVSSSNPLKIMRLLAGETFKCGLVLWDNLYNIIPANMVPYRCTFKRIESIFRGIHLASNIKLPFVNDMCRSFNDSGAAGGEQQIVPHPRAGAGHDDVQVGCGHAGEVGALRAVPALAPAPHVHSALPASACAAR